MLAVNGVGLETGFPSTPGKHSTLHHLYSRVNNENYTPLNAQLKTHHLFAFDKSTFFSMYILTQVYAVCHILVIMFSIF